MKFSFMQNPLTQIQFYAWIYNSFINSHLLEWLKVRQIKSGIRVNFDQCVQSSFQPVALYRIHLVRESDYWQQIPSESNSKTSTHAVASCSVD